MNPQEQHQQFDRWIREHIAILYRVVNGFAEGDDRNDLMQEVLLAVWKAIPSYRGQAKPTTYLYRVSHNAALTWTRAEKRHRKDPAAELSVDGEARVWESEPEDERLALIYAAIRTLPAVDRSLILLSLDGLSYDEMASIEGISQSNVGVRLNRIKQRLMRTIEKENHEPK
jgi:RNA polymerase sigma-70 factor (ECF subfamily)